MLHAANRVAGRARRTGTRGQCGAQCGSDTTTMDKLIAIVSFERPVPYNRGIIVMPWSWSRLPSALPHEFPSLLACSQPILFFCHSRP